MEQLRILYDDGALFALYKPPRIHSVRGGKEASGPSLADSLAERFPHLEQIGKSESDVGLVQRLDFETSGIVLGAHTQEMWLALHELIEKGELKKRYLALVEGHFDTTRTLSTFLGSPYRGGAKVRVYDRKPGKPHRALPGTTRFEPVSMHPTLDLSLVAAEASPARRHQVRVHAARLGHPLVGDSLYGSKTKLGHITRRERSFFLFAHYLSFSHPGGGQHVELSLSIDEELEWPR